MNFNRTYGYLSEEIFFSKANTPIRFRSDLCDYRHVAIITEVCNISMLIIASEDNRFCRAYPWRIDMSIEEVEKIVADYCCNDWHDGALNCLVICSKEDK